MAESFLLEPDLKFIRDVISKGGRTLKKCFQCATCSVVCNLSPDEAPFPRKEMIWAQWGLKERLLKDVDVWLCHQCNDCSVHCPRGAKPGDVLAALRRLGIVEYSSPRLLARMVDDPKFLPILFAIPVAILLIVLGAIGRLRIPEGEIIFDKFVPHIVVDIIYSLVALFTVIVSIRGVRRFWRDLSAGVPSSHERPSPLGFAPTHLVPIIIEILRHSKFKECIANRIRYLFHMGILFGFIALALTTASVSIGVYLFGMDPPVPLSHPIKWLGNLGALLLLVGSFLAIYHRADKGEEAGSNTYFDWVFLLVVIGTGVSGILTELFRLADTPAPAYIMYFVHLVLVFFLFAYLPFSKFAHLLYRTTALVYARYTGRELSKVEVTLPRVEEKKPEGDEGC